MKNNGLMKKFIQEGKLARVKGIEMEENPYLEGPESTSWDIGWLSIDEEEANELLKERVYV